MYAISNASRVYITSFFLLCAAVLLAPSVASANDGYWSTQERRFISQTEVNNRLNQISNSSIAKPSNSTLSTAPSAPTITKNATGGLSVTTNNILKTLDQPSSFSSTINNSAASAKTALKSCVRSPSCAGRALGAGAIIYEGIYAWKDVYDLLVDENNMPVQRVPKPIESADPMGTCMFGSTKYADCRAAFAYFSGFSCSENNFNWCPVTFRRVENTSNQFGAFDGNNVQRATFTLINNACPSGSVNTESGCVSETQYENKPIQFPDLDQMIDYNYQPDVSDAPLVLFSGDPESITLSTPAPAELPAITTTETNANNETTTKVTNNSISYTVLNNNTSNPSIVSSITETTTTYDNSANVIGTTTSTITNNAVSPDPLPPSTPNAGASVDIEIPPFCNWASIVCDWIGWTQEPLEQDEPDLSQLITVFEPDEDGFDLGIGSGSCPAPMLLNLGIIGKTVEVKYDPFCSFLEMIKPFVLAAAYLFAAYLYIGVLKRG